MIIHDYNTNTNKNLKITDQKPGTVLVRYLKNNVVSVTAITANGFSGRLLADPLPEEVIIYANMLDQCMEAGIFTSQAA